MTNTELNTIRTIIGILKDSDLSSSGRLGRELGSVADMLWYVVRNVASKGKGWCRCEVYDDRECTHATSISVSWSELMMACATRAGRQ